MDARVQDSHARMRGLLLKQPKGAGLNAVRKVARALYKGLNTPLSLRLLSALDSGDIDTIASASIDPRNYSNPLEYYYDACAVSFLKKADFLGSMGSNTLDPKQAALDSFFQSELDCSATNARITSYLEGTVVPPDVRVNQVIGDAQHLILKILGKAPAVEQLKARFGPGSTSQCNGDRVTLADKLVAYPEVTRDSLPFVKVVQSSLIWLSLLKRTHPRSIVHRFVTDDFGNRVLASCKVAPKIVRGNRLALVPKTASTHRVICIEPTLTGSIQLCVGSLLSERLEKIGIPKFCAQDVHARLAQQASRTGELVTVDLKAASDTISYQLVKLLLPSDWFDLLASLRCEETLVDDRWITNEKFSSMGNGFTFELETIIFYALTRAVSNLVDGPYQALVSCFGDDIICSRDSYDLLQKVFSFCGFTVNPTKTFVNCGFNESCGHDFFQGHRVRPYFLKEEPTDVSAWYGVCNGLYNAAKQLPGGFDPSFRRAWLCALDSIPVPLRYFGPSYLGNAVIHDEDRGRWSFKTKRAGTVRVKGLSSQFEKTSFLVPADDGILRIRGILPKPKKISMNRYCEETIFAALMYSLDAGGLIDCQAGSFSLRGKPDEFSEHWYPVV